MQLAALIPEGPLHPTLAVGAVLVGIAAAMMAGRSQRAWSLLVVFGSLTLTAAVHGSWLLGDLVEHGDRGLVLVAAVGVAVAGTAARMTRRTATLVSLAACATTWAVVPDTEAPLVAGSVLIGAAGVALVPGWLAEARRRVHGLLPALPVVAAAIGSLGRPARFGTALLVGGLAAVAGIAVSAAAGALGGRQRAGTPTTVTPAGTSSTTTAPAPTMAS